MGLPDHLCSRYLGPVLFSLQQQIYMVFLYIYIKIYKGTSLRETVCWDGQTQCCVMSFVHWFLERCGGMLVKW